MAVMSADRGKLRELLQCFIIIVNNLNDNEQLAAQV